MTATSVRSPIAAQFRPVPPGLRSGVKVLSHASRLLVREVPARVGHRLPALVTQPLADGALVLSEFRGQVLRCDPVVHGTTVAPGVQA
jgi:hypothetical protein